MKYIKFTFCILLFCVPVLLFSQEGVVKGKIADSKTNDPLIGVNITADSSHATVTDMDGTYELRLPAGSYLITLSYVGYKESKKNIDVKIGDSIQLDLPMEEEAKNVLGDELVITGSLFQKKASEEVISIEVIQPKLIQNTNVTRIDEVFRRVSGVNVVDGQANIRGGSGWAYGVGSRVAVILDGQTVLSPDRGDSKWSLLPLETVGQIEILKGASSVLYGSSAMNGTIALQTFVPTKTPVTRFTAFQSFITPPKRRITKWWDFPIPSIGVNFMRALKVNNNFEYVVGANLFLQNQHYEEGLDYLSRITYRTKWISKKNDRLSWGIAGSMMYNRETEFFYWQNKDAGALIPNAINVFSNIRITVDPYFTAFDKKGNKHEILTRLYFNRPSFDTRTILENIDYRFTKQWRDKNLTIIAGLNDQFLWIKIPAFVGQANKTGNLFAGYMQVDKKYNRLTLSAGVRLETFAYQKNVGITGTEFRKDNGKLKFYLPGQWKAGLNYQATKKASIRFNIGQAYRFPSFAERFVNEPVGETTLHATRVGCTSGDCDSTYIVSTLAILPNTDLKPEYGWTSEIGYQQKINSKGNKYFALFDIAFYWQEYKSLVDFGLDLADTTVQAYVKLKAQNISNARIAGIDLSLKQTLTQKKHVLNIMAGYNYSLPIEVDKYLGYNLNKVGPYMASFFRYMVRPVTGDTASYVLKYRNRHLITLDAEYIYDNRLTLGVDARYYSNLENFDKLFLAIPGSQYQEYYDALPKHGNWVVNARIFYTVRNRHTFGFIVKNLFNREYWLRVGKLESPRSVTLQYRFEF
jgi:iron complex outermembrane receptor protein